MFDFAGLLTGGTASVVSGLFGAALGLGQAWMNARHEAKMAELKLEEMDISNKHELSVMGKEAERAETMGNINNEREYNKLDLANLGKAIESESKGSTWSVVWADKLTGFWGSLAAFLLVIVDVVRGLTRPALTVYLISEVSRIFTESMVAANGMPPAEALEIVKEVTSAILIMTSLAMGFWFGSKGKLTGWRKSDK